MLWSYKNRKHPIGHIDTLILSVSIPVFLQTSGVWYNFEGNAYKIEQNFASGSPKEGRVNRERN